MNDKERAAMQQALEALEALWNTESYWHQEVHEDDIKGMDEAITALREVLAEQAERVTEGNGSEVSSETEAHEPVAYHVTAGRRVSDGVQVVFDDNEILYAAPQPVKQEPVDFVWVCNECDSKELTSSVSEDSLEYCACSSCGCNEFHKELITTPLLSGS